MTKASFSEINDVVLGPLRPPRRLYFLVLAFLATGTLWAAGCWIYQVKAGMGVAGISHPVGWGVYITSFVFWVGIAHSGTLISAILHLVRARWRVAVSRSAEAMTVFAVMTAGLFPLVHLGRLWAFYYIIPYPSQRQLWPSFLSPLVWDVCAVTTYLIVSTIFWYVGMIPDLAAARDRSHDLLGADHPRTRLYRRLSLGWIGAGSQWRHYGRAYLFFAALATPLVVSVHSVVSWDFAVGILPGWHTTIFAPYFVAGAIHSGLAMVLTLVIPMRRLLHLEKVITLEHFGAVAKTMLVTTLIIGYAYALEPFIAWYSGDLFERQFAFWRATGGMAWMYWLLPVLNVLVPLSFLFRGVRRSVRALFAASILVNVGMWLERLLIIASATSHDFLPHNWGAYAPTWVEISILIGSFTFFLFWFFCFARTVPTVALSDIKEDALRDQVQEIEPLEELPPHAAAHKAGSGVLAVFRHRPQLLEALRKARQAAVQRIDFFSPARLEEAEALMGYTRSPVRFWTLGGALLGVAGGFALAIGSALVNKLIAGGKPPVSIIPYCIVGFEGTILIATLANLTGMILHARLGRAKTPPCYDRRFSSDRYGLFVACRPDEFHDVRSLLSSTSAEQIHEIP